MRDRNYPARGTVVLNRPFRGAMGKKVRNTADYIGRGSNLNNGKVEDVEHAKFAARIINACPILRREFKFDLAKRAP